MSFQILIPGIFGGLLDSGIQSILLEVWGPVKSRKEFKRTDYDRDQSFGYKK